MGAKRNRRVGGSSDLTNKGRDAEERVRVRTGSRDSSQDQAESEVSQQAGLQGERPLLLVFLTTAPPAEELTEPSKELNFASSKEQAGFFLTFYIVPF